MSLFGPVTTAEIRGWQSAAGLLLHELLDRAHRDELPPIVWTLPDLGSLVARCATACEWATWLEALQLSDVRPRMVHGGRVRLRASGLVATSRGRRVTVVLLADFEERSPDHQAGCTPQDAA